MTAIVIVKMSGAIAADEEGKSDTENPATLFVMHLARGEKSKSKSNPRAV